MTQKKLAYDNAVEFNRQLYFMWLQSRGGRSDAGIGYPIRPDRVLSDRVRYFLKMSGIRVPDTRQVNIQVGYRVLYTTCITRSGTRLKFKKIKNKINIKMLLCNLQN